FDPVLQDLLDDSSLLKVEVLTLGHGLLDPAEFGLENLEEIAMLVEERNFSRQQPVQPLTRRTRHSRFRAHLFIEKFNTFAQGSQIDFVFGFEIKINRALRFSGVVSNVVYRRVVETFSAEDGSCGRQQLRFSEFLDNVLFGSHRAHILTRQSVY